MTSIIETALLTLSGVCDGASKLDGVGFNKFDSPFGKQLAMVISYGGTLTPAQANAAEKMLQKYRTQLASAGITLPEYVVKQEQQNKQTVTVKLAGRLLVIGFGGKPDPKSLDAVRSIQGRRWNPDWPGKPWTVPADQLEALKAAFPSAIYDLNQPAPKAQVEQTEQPEQVDPVEIAARISTSPCVKVTLDKNGERLLLYFNVRHPKFYEQKDKVKQINGRKWENELDNKPWSVPLSGLREVCSAFPDANIEQPVKDAFEKFEKLAQMSRKASSDFNVPMKGGELLPFQRAGVEFMEVANGRMLLADDMGLGKTIQALAYLALHPELRPAVIICPNSLKINWYKEAVKWMPTKETIAILSGSPKDTKATFYGVTIAIINYDVMGKWYETLQQWQPKIIISDEAHYLKNTKTQRTKAVQNLVFGLTPDDGNGRRKQTAEPVARVLLLTGTPVTNRPAELWPLLNLIDKVSWGNWKSFMYRYCNAYSNGFGFDNSGASNLPELHEKIKPWVCRRTKDQVLKELPAKRRVKVSVEFDHKQWAEYKAVLDQTADAVEMGFATNSQNILAQMEKLRQASARGKLQAAMNWIEDAVESNGKLVIFAIHQFVVDALMERFAGKAVKVTGEITGKARDEAVTQFQTNDNIRVMVGNVKAAGVGLTLTASSNVVFIEFPWTPGDLVQAEDRCHRIGQTDSVTVWSLVADETIDNQIVDLLYQKAEIISMVHDGTTAAESGNSVIGELAAILRQGKLFEVETNTPDKDIYPELEKEEETLLTAEYREKVAMKNNYTLFDNPEAQNE